MVCWPQCESTKTRHDIRLFFLPMRISYNHNRVPIFAVSASLPESMNGWSFEHTIDRWILQPISFRRLGELMAGTWDHERRKQDLYIAEVVKKSWERGGWLDSAPKWEHEIHDGNFLSAASNGLFKQFWTDINSCRRYFEVLHLVYRKRGVFYYGYRSKIDMCS